MNDSELSSEVLQLALRCQQGDATDEERARLEYLLGESDDARLLYSAIAHDTVTLSEVAGRNAQDLPASQTQETAVLAGADTHTPYLRKFVGTSLALAAAILAVAWSVTLFSSRPQDTAVPSPAEPVARLVHLEQAVWQPGAVNYAEWDSLQAGDHLQLSEGMVELVVNNAVQLVLQGPVDFELVSKQKAVAHAGKLVARVSHEGIGFEIDTPHAQVIDQGTAFSISVSPEAQTDVVVYEGTVDLGVTAAKGDNYRRLKTGEAMRVGREGTLERITSVESSNFLPPLRLGREAIQTSQLIASVTDNVSSLRTAKYYRIVGKGFAEDCPAYVDRFHQWNGLDQRGIPSFLRGADYVMTFNDDKILGNLQIALDLAQPASVFVLWDDRIECPDWLKSSFVDTGWDIGLDEGFPDRYPVKSRITEFGAGNSIDFVFSIWRQDVSRPATVMLGPVQGNRIDEVPREVSQSMYGIAVTPLPPRE